MDENEGFSIATKVLQLLKGKAGSPCDQKAAIDTTDDAVNDMNKAIFSGDAESAESASVRGKLHVLGLDKIKTSINQSIKRANVWNKETFGIEHENFFDSKPKYQSLNEIENIVDPQNKKIFDMDQFLDSKQARAYLTNENARNIMDKAMKNDELKNMFSRGDKVFGDHFNAQEYEQFSNEDTRNALKLYNIALNNQDMHNLAVKFAESEMPSEEMVKYVSQKALLDNNINAEFDTMYREMLNKLPQKKANISDDLNRAIFKEVSGEHTGNSTASQIASIWKKIMDNRKRLLGDRGLLVDTLENYFPNLHSAIKISKAGFEQFAEDAKQFFDFDKMGVAEEEKDAVIRDIYNGFSNRSDKVAIKPVKTRFLGEDAKIYGTDGYATTYTKKRIIHFKDGDSLYNYYQKYGRTNSSILTMNHYINDSINQISNASLFRAHIGFDALKDSLYDEISRNRTFKEFTTLLSNRFNKGIGSEAKQTSYKEIMGLLMKKDIVKPQELDERAAKTMFHNEVDKGTIPKWFEDMAFDSSKKYDPATDTSVLTKRQRAMIDNLNTYLKGGFTREGENPSVVSELAAGVVQLGTSSMYLGSGLWGVLGDRASMMLMHSRLGKDILPAIAESFKAANLSSEELKNIGISFEHKRMILNRDTELNHWTMMRNNMTDKIQKINGIDTLTRINKAGQRISILQDLTKYASKSHEELPPELQELFNKKAWETFRNTKGNVEMIHGNPIVTPQRVMFDEGFSDKEREAATHINGAVNNLIASGVQEGDLISRMKYAMFTEHADNPITKLAARGIFTAASIPMSFERRILPSLVHIMGHGKYGTLGAVLGYAIALNCTQRIAKLFLAGKYPTAKTFKDPKFYMDALVDSGVAMGWTGSTAYNMLMQDSFVNAGSGLVGASGLKTTYDVTKLIGATLSGNPKKMREHAKQVFGNDITMKRMPVVGLLSQRLLYDNIAAMFNPDIEAARKREIDRAKRDGTPYYWEP